ncbi:hypothetical protein [Streptomyces sp. GSL17-113]|uniref:hypothetical protein n=1 Tax=Actinomycetes TaxID=1760 RepID=UPI002E7721AB|nr:hypothetical protein [Streptomyces sp. GSL17-113]
MADIDRCPSVVVEAAELDDDSDPARPVDSTVGIGTDLTVPPFTVFAARFHWTD